MDCFYKRLEDLGVFTSWVERTGRKHVTVYQENEKTGSERSFWEYNKTVLRLIGADQAIHEGKTVNEKLSDNYRIKS